MRPAQPFTKPASPAVLFLIAATCCLPPSLLSITVAEAATHHGGTVVTAAQCHAWGFDPHSLSCDTCAVLSSHPSLVKFQDECRQCCQSWRPDPVVDPSSARAGYVGRYQLAVLTYDPSNLDRWGDELKRFLEEDRDEVKAQKGAGAFAVVEKSDEDDEEDGSMMGGNADLMMALGGMMRVQRPPRIYFFRERGDGRVKTSKADETVTLNGWKREDIKDMLLTVLP